MMTGSPQMFGVVVYGWGGPIERLKEKKVEGEPERCRYTGRTTRRS